MRKLINGLTVRWSVVGLLVIVASPAMAQFLDPLTVATSGVLLPFAGSGNNVSILETAAPVAAIPGLHIIFYNALCSRGEDRPLPLTENDVDVRVIAANSPGAPAPNTDGLLAIAKLAPLEPALGEGLHSRMYWFDVNETKFRVLEPVILEPFDATARALGSPWDPIRTGVTFYAPNQSAGHDLRTTLYLICPRNTIQGSADFAEAFPVGSGFPAVGVNVDTSVSPAAAQFKSTIPSGTLTGFVFDDEEAPLASINAVCNCLTTLPLASVSTVYTQQNSDTYTELVTDGSFPGFTGYKSITHAGVAAIDFFGRLSDGNRRDILGQPCSGLCR
jgi:hypothetical protein